MENVFQDTVLRMYKENQWEQILGLDSEHKDARRLLWAWPTPKNLGSIAHLVHLYNLDGVISIGCGCGLFEWLLSESSGLNVVGYEINEEWWTSKYSIAPFIPLTFPKIPQFPKNYALVFCYFNDGDTFRKYVSLYDGPLIFIIGPGPQTGRYCDPSPFNPGFGNRIWTLYKREKMQNEDFMAAFVNDNI